MGTNADLPSTCYISDAAVNHAEALYGVQPCNVGALTDLVNIVQSAVMHESLVVSPVAKKGSSLLSQLDFADCFKTSEETVGDQTHFHISAPIGQTTPGDILIDRDEHGELYSPSPVGELFLATAWTEILQDHPTLGALVRPERATASLSETYFNKLVFFMMSLQARRNLMHFENDEARAHFKDESDQQLDLYGMLTRRLITCRDQFNLGYQTSVIEEPIFALSLSIQANQPFEYLRQFDENVEGLLKAGREAAFERWNLPAVGASVLGRCDSLDDLPNEIARARERMGKPREKVRDLNARLLELERDVALGDDAGMKELNKVQVQLQKALQAFAEETEYQEEAEAYPITERIWNMSTLLNTLLQGFKSPAGLLDKATKAPWAKRQSYLRRVPGMKNAAGYTRQLRAPIMRKLIHNFGRLNWERAQVQAETLDWCSNLVQRCAVNEARENIGNKVLFNLTADDDQQVPVDEDHFWYFMLTIDGLRERFFPLDDD